MILIIPEIANSSPTPTTLANSNFGPMTIQIGAAARSITALWNAAPAPIKLTGMAFISSLAIPSAPLIGAGLSLIAVGGGLYSLERSQRNNKRIVNQNSCFPVLPSSVLQWNRSAQLEGAPRDVIHRDPEVPIRKGLVVTGEREELMRELWDFANGKEEVAHRKFQSSNGTESDKIPKLRPQSPTILNSNSRDRNERPGDPHSTLPKAGNSPDPKASRKALRRFLTVGNFDQVLNLFRGTVWGNLFPEVQMDIAKHYSRLCRTGESELAGQMVELGLVAKPQARPSDAGGPARPPVGLPFRLRGRFP